MSQCLSIRYLYADTSLNVLNVLVMSALNQIRSGTRADWNRIGFSGHVLLIPTRFQSAYVPHLIGFGADLQIANRHFNIDPLALFRSLLQHEWHLTVHVLILDRPKLLTYCWLITNIVDLTLTDWTDKSYQSFNRNLIAALKLKINKKQIKHSRSVTSNSIWYCTFP